MMPIRLEKLKWWGFYRPRKKYDDILIRFHKLLWMDRETQTTASAALRIATRANKMKTGLVKYKRALGDCSHLHPHRPFSLRRWRRSKADIHCRQTLHRMMRSVTSRDLSLLADVRRARTAFSNTSWTRSNDSEVCIAKRWKSVTK